jgi:hypothetical protein
MMKFLFHLCSLAILTVSSSADTLATTSSSSGKYYASSKRIFSPDQIQAFVRDGFLVVSGLLEEDKLNDVIAAGSDIVASKPSVPFYFSVTQQGALFGSINDNSDRGHQILISNEGPFSTTSDSRHLEEENNDPGTKAFRHAALYSKFPQAAAELMQLDPETQNVRVLRYVTFCFSSARASCFITASFILARKKMFMQRVATHTFLHSLNILILTVITNASTITGIFFSPRTFMMTRRVTGTWTTRDSGPRVLLQKPRSSLGKIRMASMSG